MLIEAAGAPPDKPFGTGPTGPRSTSSTGNATGSALGSASREVLAAQASMRREIVEAENHKGAGREAGAFVMPYDRGPTQRRKRATHGPATDITRERPEPG